MNVNPHQQDPLFAFFPFISQKHGNLWKTQAPSRLGTLKGLETTMHTNPV